MKKVYTAPQLTVHGSVEDLTQVIGRSSAQDFFIFAGQTVNVGFTDGSSDLEFGKK
ncbi:MAG TPA: lasso peptide [Crinalium sp.]|jgi:hypothetical protein